MMLTTALTPSQEAVLNSLRNAPRTAEQISVDTGYSSNTVRPRLIELTDMGLVEVASETRRTRSGREARIYKAVV